MINNAIDEIDCQEKDDLRRYRCYIQLVKILPIVNDFGDI